MTRTPLDERWIRVGFARNVLILAGTYPPGSRIHIGSDPRCELVVEDFADARFLVLEGTTMHLRPDSIARVSGLESDADSASEVSPRVLIYRGSENSTVRINGTRVNCELSPGLNVFISYEDGPIQTKETP